MAGHGEATLKEGLAVHLYAFDTDMRREAFVNHDGELLIVPQVGTLNIQTELGHLLVYPGEIAVIPAGFRFAVRIAQDTSSLQSRRTQASGYLLELFGSRFTLPELGPLGANGLAHDRDFEYPTAAFDVEGGVRLTVDEETAGELDGDFPVRGRGGWGWSAGCR